jgi:SOS-response transcriptional repressor LexA
MLYRNSHLRSIANHVIETGKSTALKQYAQALVRKINDWDSRIIERLKANGVESSYADNELNKSYQAVEDLAKSLATLTGAELDAKFKAQMISLAKQTAPRFKNDISLLDDKDLEGIAAEISGSNNSVSQEINAG